MHFPLRTKLCLECSWIFKDIQFIVHGDVKKMYLVRPTKTEKVLTSPISKEEQERETEGGEGEGGEGGGKRAWERSWPANQTQLKEKGV